MAKVKVLVFGGGQIHDWAGIQPKLVQTLEEAGKVAETIRDPSPRVSSRVTSLLARHALDELFEKHLVGLKPGKIDILRRHYDRLRRGDGDDA